MKTKFVVSDALISESFGTKHIVILADLEFWNEHWEELLIWCREHGCEQKGVTVDVPSDQTMTLFALRWA